MGLFNDHRNTNRESWKFTYTGSQLLEAAKKKQKEFYDKEVEARGKMSALMGDLNVSTKDPKIQENKELIEKTAIFGNNVMYLFMNLLAPLNESITLAWVM